MILSAYLRKMSCNVITCMLVSLAFHSVQAQGNTASGIITGRILTDYDEPASFASVAVKDHNKGIMADADGKFEMHINPGKYILIVRLIGHVDEEIPIEVKAGQTTEIPLVRLKEDGLQLDEVEIVSQSKKREIEEKGYAVNVISTKDVELQSIQANELLDRSAGVRVRQQGGLGSHVQYNINGLSGNSVRIFIDGIPVSAYGPSFSLNSIPNSMIERIEVYKGVIPAYLSDDALGGAINVVLKKSMKSSLDASYSFGSFNTHQININGVFRNDSTGLTARASGFYNYSDNSYKVWGDKVYITHENLKVERITARRFHDGYRSWGGKLDAGFTGKRWADQFLLGVVFSDMTKDVQHGATMEIVYGNRRARQNTQLYSLTYSKKDFLVKGLDVSLFSSYSFLNRQVTDTIPYMYNWKGQTSDLNKDGKLDEWASGAEGSRPTLQTSLEKNFTSRASISYWLADNHKLNLNYIITDFSRDQDDAMYPMAERALMDTRYFNKSILAAAYESRFFGPRLRTSLFFKYYSQSVRLKDYTKDRSNNLAVLEHDKKVAIPGYGIAMSYAILHNIMITASAERAVRLPETTEIFGNSAENIDPSYGLRPEQSQNLNLGLHLGAFRIKKHSLSLITNVFYRNVSEMIRQGLPSSQVSETYKFENLESVISKGFDAELNYNFNDKIIYTAGASVFNGRFNTEFDPEGARYGHYKKRLRNAPFFTANSNLQYKKENLFRKNSLTSFYYNLGYVHEFFRDWEGVGRKNKPVIPTQIVHDVGIAYTFPNKKITLGLDAKNIFNRQVFDNWALQKPGRAFYAKVSYKII